MNRIVFDVETNGLLNDLTQVHSLVLRDRDTGEVMSCTDSSVPESRYSRLVDGLDVLAKADTIYAHNAIDFDIPALQKVFPWWKPEGQVVDTLVVVRHLFAHIKETDYARARRGKLPGNLIGAHSLKAWGYRLGVLKGEYGETTDWSTWTPSMQGYCEQDTMVNLSLVQKIAKTYISKEAIDNDMEVAWYLSQQQRNGWPFDFEAAVRLQAELSQVRSDLGEKLREHFGVWYRPGKPFIPKRSNKRYGYVEGCEATKILRTEFNPASRDHIADRLQKLYGWKPEVFTPSGKPKVDETTLKGVELPGFPFRDALLDYLTVDKRLGQLAEGDKAWLKYMTLDEPLGGAITGMNHIHHSAAQTTITHRHRHAGPNIAQVPSADPKTRYGKECRALFVVPPGWKLLGADLSGLELRCLAHYMAKWDGGEYGRIILEGDIHTANMEAAGIDSRYDAKTFIYAYLYGAGNEKLGSILYPEYSSDDKKDAGKTLRRRFERKIPALGSLQKAIQKKARDQGYLKLPDGRRAYIRHQHAALNTLLQGAGAVHCKTWVKLISRDFTEAFGDQGWNGDWAGLAWVHDEVQIAVRPEIAEVAGEVAVKNAEHLTEVFKWRVPLTGEAIIGDTWADTH